VGPRRFPEGVVRDRLTDCSDLRTPTVLVRRDALLAVGGFREALRCHEDTDLWFRLATASYRFVAVRAPVAIVHRHLDSHLHADPGARAQAFRFLDAEWGPVIRQRGARAYRRWRAAYQAWCDHIEFMRVVAALGRGDRAAAWCIWFGMTRRPDVRWLTQALAALVLGRRIYSCLAAARAALSRRPVTEESSRLH
jgi:hypothetical protein